MNAAFLLLTVLGAVLLTVFVQRWRVQPGLVIVIVAGAISFIPGLPRFEAEPEVILSVVMPPLIYSAALNFSTTRFAKNFRPIVILGVGLVLVTAFALAGLGSWLVPGLGFAGALVLAAVVSPPDTVTTVTKGAEIGLPRRVIDLLTGESLINDATALVVFALAVASVTGAHSFIENPVLYFLYTASVGVVLGALLGGIAVVIRSRVQSAAVAVVINLLVPFTAFLLAEELHASGVLAVVTAGFSVAGRTSFEVPGHEAPAGYRARLQERQLWPVVDLLLEAFVFSYIGLQLRFVLEDVAAETPLLPAIGVALLVLLAVVVIRFAWVYLVFGRWAWEARMFRRRMERDPLGRARFERVNAQLVARGRRPREAPLELSWKENLLVSWTGMRGIVTLAAAGGIPLATLAGEPFPGRAVIQLTAFVVAIGTLLIQGLSLPWLARRLAIDTSADDAEAEAELDRAGAVAALGPDPLALQTADFDAARARLTRAMQRREIDEDAARTVIERIDLEQAAREARED